VKGRIWAALLAGLFLALVAAAPAQAHAALVRTDPPPGSVLNSAPQTVTLTFSEQVRPIADRIRVLAPDRSRVDTDEASVTGDQLTIKLRGGLGTGTYLVTYRVISADSHPIAGSFPFSVGAPSSNPPGESDAANRRADPLVAVALGVARWAGYAGLILLAGPLLFLTGLWPKRLSRREPARLIAAGLIALGVGTVAEMYLQGPYTAGTGLFGVSGRALRDALAGGYGATHVVRLAVIAAVAVMARPFLRPAGPSTVDRAGLAFVSVIGIGTWPLSGHPAVSPAPAISLVADAGHLAAMAGWLGGLVLLLTVLLRRANGRELAAILPVWSAWALLAVVTLVMTGTAQATIEVQSVPALFSTEYGRLVLAKAALLAVVVAIAWYSRRLVGRVVAGQAAKADPAVAVLRRTVLAELAIAAVVVGVAAALVQAPPARTAGTAPEQPFTVTLTNDLYTLRFDLSPVEVGSNSMHLFALDRTGRPMRVLEWKVTATPADGSLEPMSIPVLPITDDHAVAEPSFPSPGMWELRFTLRISDVDQATVAQSVRIK
jgi:copper transport protein